MSADLVDQLAGNAPVITQFSNHLFASGLIVRMVHLNSSSFPYDRATKLINAVLATLQSNHSPNSVLSSLINVLFKVGLDSFAENLSEKFSKGLFFNM